MHVLNPKTGENYKIGGESSESQAHSEFPGERITFSDQLRDSGWLLCFSAVKVEPQHLSLSFY